MRIHVYLAIALCGTPQIEGQVRPPSFRIETVAGNPRNGDNGAAQRAQIGRIQGLALDRQGNLYLSDTDHHRVRRVGPDGIIATVAGTGTAGYSGDGGWAVQARLNLPYGVAADAAGNVYIADLGNNRIRCIGTDGRMSTVAPSIALATPRNLAVDEAGNLYVAEFDGHRVRRISPAGTVTVVAGTGKPGYNGDGIAAEQAQLRFPAGIAIDGSGALWIADSGNNRVRRVVPGGAIETVLGGFRDTALATPVAVAVDAQGTVYVGDAASVVRSYSPSGVWKDFAGRAEAGFAGDGGAATEAMLSTVRDLAAASERGVWIADGPRVRLVDAGGLIWTMAGDGYQHGLGDGGPAADAVFSRPTAIVLDSLGRMTVADGGTGRVRQVSAAGIVSTLASFGEPAGVAVDISGRVWVADAVAGTVRTLGSDGVPRTVASGLRGPRGLCLGRNGAAYLTDTGRGRLMRAALSVDSVADGMTAPEGCAVDSADSVYIAETGGHRILRWSSTGGLAAVAGTGEAGAGGDEGPARAARLAFPRGVAVDDSGNVYIADTGNHKIRMITTDGVIHTVAGTAEGDFAGDGGPALAARLNGPAGVYLDGAGILYVADSLNDRIRRLLPMGYAEPVMLPPVPVENAFSGVAGSIAPGEVVRVSGSGDEVRFAGLPGRILSGGNGQLLVQVPQDLPELGQVRVEMWSAGGVTAVSEVAVREAVPGILPLVVNQDGTVNGETQPAAWGTVVRLFGTGFGRMAEGRPVLHVSAMLEGIAAEVLDAAAAPGSPGLVVIAVRIPGGFLGSGAAALILSAGSEKAPPLTLWVSVR